MSEEQQQALTVFIAYSRADKLLATTIAEILLENGFNPWFDQSIMSGQDWQQEIQAQIVTCDVCIVLVSRDSVQSDYVRYEYMEFLRYMKPVIPIIIRRIRLRELPEELARIQYVDAANGLKQEQIDRLLDALYYYAASFNKLPRRPQVNQERAATPQPLITYSTVPPTASTSSSPTESMNPQKKVKDETKKTPSSKRMFDISARGLGALSDRPITDEGGDYLGFETYVSAIAEFVMHPNTMRPLVLSINAEWGAGKSSLMHMIKNELPEETPRVWFNAWRYDGEEVLWAALALAVIQQTIKSETWWRRLWLERQLLRFDGRRFLTDLMTSVLYVVLVAIFGALALLIVEYFSTGSMQLSDLVDLNTGPIVVASLLVGGLQFGRRMMKEIRDSLNLDIEKYTAEQPDYEDRIGFLLEFQKNFDRVVDIVTDNENRPLVIFIDDLDRCSVPKVAQLVEAMNIFLSSKGCVFIVGMDMKTVAASIEIQYGRLRDYLARNTDANDPALGRFFLEKIVQISFPIPRTDHKHMMRFVRHSLGETIESLSPQNTKSAEDLHNKVKSSLQNTYSAEVLYNKILPLAENFILEPDKQTAETDIEDETERAIKQEELRKRVAELAQQVFAMEILDRFNEMDEVTQLIETMLPYLDYNPRRVKRFINVFRLQAFIAIKRGSLADHTQLSALGTWLEIALRWPLFAVEMIDDPMLDDDFFFVASTLEQVGDKIEQARNDPSFKARLDRIEELEREKPLIAAYKDDKELISLLPRTTAFNDDDTVDILQLAVQIASSARLKQMQKATRNW